MSGFSIRTESRLLSLVNTCDDSDELTRLLDPKHTGSFTRAAVEMILAAKEDQPEKCFMHFEQIQNLLPRDSATDRQSCTFERFQELLQNFRENAEELPEHGYPVLLLPVRLETRFTASKLMVRIYPDQIFIHAHDKSLTLPEYEAAKVYRAQFAEDQEHAWRVLSSAFGPARAAWIAAWVKTHHFQSGEEAQLPKTKLRVPRLQSLPDAFSVSAYRNGRVTTVQTAPVQPGLTVLGDFGNLQEGLFDDHSRWMVDFNAALESGMAVEIPLLYEGSAYQEHADLREGCDRLVVVGIKRTTPQTGRLELEALIDAHHYSSGIAFVEPGTPTNNTGEVRSSFVSGEDHDASYIVEVQGPLNWTSLTQEKRERINACRLASVLGMDPEKLRYLEGAESDVDSYAAEMNTILWTVTGEYYFQHLLPGLLSGADLARLRTFVKHFVRGGSFLPSIRIGRQPYGVLPVTRVPQNTKDGWVQWGGSRPDARFEQALHFTVSELHKKWLRYAVDSRRVPRVGIEGEDPDQTLLGILSMEPYSVTYQARPFLDEGFIALLLAVLREYAFGSDSAYVQAGKTPEEWMASWAYTWDLARGRAAALLSEISGAAPAVFQNGQENEAAKQVLRLLGWGKGETEPIGMVVNPEDGRAPSDYLADIYRSTSAKPGTLLGHMALRALKQTQQSSSLHKEIKDAISSLSSFSALDFFNTASDAGQISRRIEDDPAVHPERRGYGVPKKIAARILERREELGGRFSSIEQIQDVYRVGLDTMHDFLYTFQEDRPTPDIDRLFRESLDIASHRVDAWVTSFAAKRLIDIRTKPDTRSGIYLGAYGFVEDLEPRGNLPLSVGYLHAPSAGQAAAGAVLYNAFLTHDPLLTADTPDTVSDTNPFHINLTSERVRKALSILDGIRQGQPLGALLGFQFERALRDAAEPLQQYIHDFRESFPLVAYKLTPAQTENSDEPASAEAAAARNAADGTALIRDYHGEAGTEGQVRRILDSCPENHRDRLEEILENLANTLDGVASNLLHESVYQSVQGNFERAGAVLEAGSGNLPVPELESIKIDIPYRSMHCRTGMLFEKRLRDTVGTDPPAFPREAAEPRIAAWFNTVLGSLDDIGITFEFREEETDPDILSLVNVNTADAAKLRKIPGIGPDLAASIIRERSSERGLFNQTGDLVRVNGIGDKKLIKMRPFITTGYVERVNINTAIEEELCAAAGISEETAKKIVEARSSGPFAVISDLLRCGIDEENVEVIRPKAITGYNNLSLDRCGLSRIDFLYLAQFPAEGEETEIEQRLARFVRDDNALPAGQRVMIHADRRGACRNSLADAIELCRSVLDLLSGGKPMSPDTMRHAAESAPEGYSADDVERLTARLEAAQGWLDVLICEFNGVETPCTVRLQLTGESSARLPAGTQVRHRRTNTLWKLEKEAVNGSGGTV
ncbi:MAG: helix-hairpin-helix domain-containing protein, partial [Anaerolineales bacterium]|nr:helix-hairpin-helix domain-containing protein [Anaerolineales bacterium]